MNFTKMQSLGNDYICIDCFHYAVFIKDIIPYISTLCDKHFGIGGDGVIFIIPSSTATAKMLMYNKDGSESRMCGNGIFLVAKYLFDTKLTTANEFTIETKAGIKNIKLEMENGEVKNISVNMGAPSFVPQKIPVLTEKSIFLNESITLGKQDYRITCLSMGNPHAVIFTKYIKNLKLYQIGPKLETHYIFPERTNVELVEKIDDKKIKIRIWERGTGEALSCGSGACASVAAGVITGELSKNMPIRVEQSGGTLQVEYNENVGMILTGPAEKVYDGKILLKKSI